MPSVYEYHHVELDKVGKGKRVLKPPGGESSNIFGGESPSTPSNGFTSPGSRGTPDSSSTRNRLFGDEATSPESENGSPRRRVSIDRMKSNIFASGGDQVDSSPKSGSAKKLVRRNPITGEILDEEKATNGHTNGNSNGHIEEKITPTQVAGRVRKPPGGESSGIF